MTESEFFERIAAGESVKALCRERDCPYSHSGFYRQIVDDAELWDRYARAKQAGQHAAVDSIMSVIDQEEDVHRARLKVDAIKWSASKLAPKVYGDKLEIGGSFAVTIAAADADL